MNLVEATIAAGSHERGAATYARSHFTLKGFRRVIICLSLGALLSSLISSGVHASSLRIQGELIRAGTSVASLVRVLGPPEHRTVVYACPDGCAPNYEIWQYRVNDLNYEFDVRGGRVESVRWSRF